MSPTRSNVSVRKQKIRKKEEQRENQQLAAEWKNRQQSDESISNQDREAFTAENFSAENEKSIPGQQQTALKKSALAESDDPGDNHASTRFQANNQYFTIAIYVIAVVATAAQSSPIIFGRSSPVYKLQASFKSSAFFSSSVSSLLSPSFFSKRERSVSTEIIGSHR